MKKLAVCLAVVGGLGLSAPVTAEVPIQFATINNYKAPHDEVVKGVRFPTIHGKTSTVTGVDLHLLAIGETDNFTGVQFPLFLGGANHINESMTGVAFGLWNWNKGETVGANLGFVNVTNNVTGINLGSVNYSVGYTALDASFANVSKKSAAQLGFLNVTDEIEVVQIGLLNCARNGFLPCFPLVNFPVN